MPQEAGCGNSWLVSWLVTTLLQNIVQQAEEQWVTTSGQQFVGNSWTSPLACACPSVALRLSPAQLGEKATER
jgi:hypothetical protein